jgi:PAS domain S-box-containing protein
MSIDTAPTSTDGQVQDLQPRLRSGPIKILIVDDEPKNLTVLETILDNPNYRLVRAETAEQALLALVDDEFALLILDIQMPGMTGFELAQMIKQRRKTAQVPIIFLTAYYNEDQHVLEGYGTGAVDYLHKPINPAILRSKVAVFADLHNKNRILRAEVIERRRAEGQLRELNETLEQRVTERTEALVRTRIALNETDEQYRSLFEGSLDAIFSLDVDERFKSANPATLRLTARTIEELKTIRFLDLCAPGQQETVEHAFRAAFRRQGFAIDTTVVTSTGERRNLFISGGPTIQDGEVVGISCIARDITERIKTEEVLRSSEARYRELIHALPAAVCTTDEQGRITLYNQAAVALWGRDPKVGKDLWCGSWKIYRPDGSPLPLDQCPMAVTLHEGRAVRGEEIVIERPDGTRRHVLPHPEPMRNADGGVIGAINMLVDITDRKEAEKAVARLAAIVTSSDDAIIGKDLHGIVTSWNQGAERLFGYAAEEMIGQPVLRLIPPERHDEESQILEQMKQGKPINHHETIRRCKDGTDLTVSLTVSPVLSEGRIIGASKIVRDISEQKRVETALRHSERNLSDFFDNASVGLHWVGPDGLIIKANQTELDLLGYSREEYVGHHVAEFHVDQTAIQNIMHCLIRGDTLHEYPAKIRRKDGSVLDVLINSNALFEDNKFIHTRSFTRDITERKQIEADLRESEERLRLAQQAGKIGTFEWNMKTGVTTWTKELEAMYGLPPGGFPGTQGAWESLVHSEDRPLALERVKHSIDTNEPGEAEFRIVWPDGSTHWVAGRWQIFNDITGSPLCLAGVNIDITARKQSEEALLEHDRTLTKINAALKSQALALADANRELEKFSYSVSHDLRAPLRTIDAFSRILEEDHGSHMNESARRNLSIIRKSVGQAGELIDDLLGFSKLGRQGMTVRFVNMADLAREAVDDLRMHENRQVDVAIGDLPPCQGDPRFLKLVWINLLTNAFKYSKNRNESRIEVGWMPDDASSEMVIYYVKDNGIGFDMKYVHKLFGVFQRLHRQEDFEGTGVGLAVVQRIVQRHDGRVWAEGKVDGGATFFVSLRKAMA